MTAPSPQMTDEEPTVGITNVTLRNSLAVNEIANVIWAWRHGQVNNYDALKRIEKSIREYREDLYV